MGLQIFSIGCTLVALASQAAMAADAEPVPAYAASPVIERTEWAGAYAIQHQASDDPAACRKASQTDRATKTRRPQAIALTVYADLLTRSASEESSFRFDEAATAEK